MRPLEFIHLDKNGNPSLRFIVLGEPLPDQSLGILEQVKDFNEYVLRKMGGKILGYN